MEASEKETRTSPIVNSYNEWDLLEEVIVGVLDYASVPPWHITLKATMPEKHWGFYQKYGGSLFPQEQIEGAKKDLEEFVHILEAEGVIVRRPDIIRYDKPFATPDWECAGGLYGAMPRDLLLVVGDEIIETPMAWRCRYFETHAYRSLLKEYFKKGARWTAAPKPQLTDELYHYDYQDFGYSKDMDYAITEFEPTFDAADFIRCGKDIFVLKSHVTNDLGIMWVRRHLGDQYTIHEVEVIDTHPMHIDTSFMPLAPGKLLVHPERMKNIPPMFKSWDVLYAPEPCMSPSHTLYMSSAWISMNVLMLDHERVIVEKNEELLIKALKDFGLKPIPCSFTHFNTFGGAFHCATLDIRRKGGLQSYF